MASPPPPTPGCLLLAFFVSSASENSLSDVGSHLTVFEGPNFEVVLLGRELDGAVVPFFAYPFSFLLVNS